MNKLRMITVVGAAVVASSFGCGRLSKSSAHDIIKTTYYDKDDNAYCTWDLGHLGVAASRKPSVREFDYIPDPSDDQADDDQACVAALVSAGILKKKGEPVKYPAMMGGGTDYFFTLPKDVDFTKDGELQFPCGKKSLGEVDSVSTEGKKATVKYTRTITRDPLLAKKLDVCARLEGPDPGTHRETMTMSKDDDGRWAPEN